MLIRLFLEFFKVTKILVKEGDKLVVKSEIKRIKEAVSPREKARLLSDFLNG